MQPFPSECFTQVAALHRNAIDLEAEPIQPACAGQVGAHAYASQLQALSELDGCWLPLSSRLYECLQALPWWLFSGADGAVDLCRCQAFPCAVFWPALVFVVVQAFRDRQAVPALQGLGCFNGFWDFPLAQPDRAAEADPAGDDVDVVVISVLVANRSPCRVLGKLHLLHKVAGDGVPLLSAELLAWWQRK